MKTSKLLQQEEAKLAMKGAKVAFTIPVNAAGKANAKPFVSKIPFSAMTFERENRTNALVRLAENQAQAARPVESYNDAELVWEIVRRESLSGKPIPVPVSAIFSTTEFRVLLDSISDNTLEIKPSHIDGILFVQKKQKTTKRISVDTEISQHQRSLIRENHEEMQRRRKLREIRLREEVKREREQLIVFRMQTPEIMALPKPVERKITRGVEVKTVLPEAFSKLSKKKRKLHPFINRAHEFVKLDKISVNITIAATKAAILKGDHCAAKELSTDLFTLGRIHLKSQRRVAAWKKWASIR